MQIISDETMCPIHEIVVMVLIFGGFIPLLMCMNSPNDRPIIITVSCILMSIGCIMFMFL